MATNMKHIIWVDGCLSNSIEINWVENESSLIDFNSYELNLKGWMELVLKLYIAYRFKWIGFQNH